MSELLLSAVTMSATLALFVAVFRLVCAESEKGERIILGRFRGALDRYCEGISYLSNLASKKIMRTFSVRSYRSEDQKVASALMRHATKTPLTVTHTNNHLSQMRDYKSEIALTPAQKRKLRKQKLEERF